MCQISSLMAAAEGPVAEFSSFANLEEKKRLSNLLMSFPKTGNQMGSFGQIRKKIVFSLLLADSQYFRIYALKYRVKLKVTMHLQGCLACKRCSVPGLNCRYLNHYIKLKLKGLAIRLYQKCWKKMNCRIFHDS